MQSPGNAAIGNLDSILKNKMPVLGIDLGGTKILAAPVTEGRPICEPVRESTPSGPEKIIAKLLELIEHFQKEHLLAGVGIATAGIVDPNTGEIVGSTGNLPGWSGTRLKQVLESKIILPVHVENDANAAAYGEAYVRNLKDKECVVLLTIGTGLGGGILMKGELYRGQHFGAGECGHIRIALNNERLCTCGLFDCWETFVAGRGLVATTKQVLTETAVQHSSLNANIETITTEAIFQASQDGDLLAQRAIKIWHEHLCAGMVSIAHTLDPDCFILAGGLSKFVDLEFLSELILDKTLSHVGENLQVYKSELGNLAGIIGAAHIVLDKIASA